MERHGFFKPKFRFNSRTSLNTPPNLRSEVIINVGLIESNDKGIVKIKRDSKIPVKTEKIFTAEEDVQKAAIKKHSEIDQYFCNLGKYLLCFPDQKVLEYILGTSGVFTVEKYKEFLSKPYSKVGLYLCNISNIAVDNSRINENNVAVSNKNHDLNTGLQLPVAHDSLLAGIGSILMSSLEDSSRIEEGLSSINGAYDNFALDFSTTSNCSLSNTATERTLADPNLQDNHQRSSTNPHNAANVVNTEHRVYCPISNNQFPISIIEEHANTCLERKNNPLISHRFHDDLEESDNDKQYFSDECHVNINKEKIPSEI